MQFTTYHTQLNDALNAENGPNLANLLRPTSPHGKDLVKEFRNPTVRLHFPCPDPRRYPAPFWVDAPEGRQGKLGDRGGNDTRNSNGLTGMS